MAPSPKPWFRFYVEALHDRKIRRQRPEFRWLFVAVLAIARSSSDHGFLRVGSQPATVEDIADVAALTHAVTKRGLLALSAEGLLTLDQGIWQVVKWDERQFESDVSTERVRAMRERRSGVTSAVAKTPPESESESEENSSSQQQHAAPVENPDPTDDETSRKARTVLEHIADARLERVTNVTNPDRYRARILSQLVDELDMPRLRRIIDAHPLAPTAMLADAALGQQTPYLKDYRSEATA